MNRRGAWHHARLGAFLRAVSAQQLFQRFAFDHFVAPGFPRPPDICDSRLVGRISTRLW